MRAVTAPLAGTEEGRTQLTQGAGGDITIELDRRSEAEAVAVLEELSLAGAKFSLLSEEIGLRSFGADYPLVLLDPIDGSLNAKQGIPAYALMLAIADGPRLGDLRVAHVTNLVSAQAWTAVRGEGAFLNGKLLEVLSSSWTGRMECLGLESSPRSLTRAAPLIERAAKIRILGSMALSICHAASGGLDVFCCPIEGRMFDMTASLLVLREAGGIASDMRGEPIDDKPLDLECRTTLLAASNPDVHAMALDLAQAGRPARR